MTGGHFEHFRAAWAVDVFVFDNQVIGHYFVRSRDNIGIAKTLCGQEAAVNQLYGLGGVGKCPACYVLVKGAHT